MNQERYRPKRHKPPVGFLASLIYVLRLCVDLQTASSYWQIRKFLKTQKGSLLDVGCGDSPYRHLINETRCKYTGIDISDAEKFDYQKSDIVHFDGRNIPFEDDCFDSILCTEVLEHVQDYQCLIDEMFRVLKPGGQVFVSIPWSARTHYIPYDFYRYTPSQLKIMFSKFEAIEIIPRGTDVSSISSKIIVLYFRNVFPIDLWRYVFSPLWIFFMTPILLISIIFGHIGHLLNFGDCNDPLGYTIKLKK